jgi:hypothetical protein
MPLTNRNMIWPREISLTPQMYGSRTSPLISLNPVSWPTSDNPGAVTTCRSMDADWSKWGRDIASAANRTNWWECSERKASHGPGRTRVRHRTSQEPTALRFRQEWNWKANVGRPGTAFADPPGSSGIRRSNQKIRSTVLAKISAKGRYTRTGESARAGEFCRPERASDAA